MARIRLGVVIATLSVSACTKEPPHTPPAPAPVAVKPKAVEPPRPADFECVRCGKRHEWKELAFAWPDASAALTVSPDEQAKIRTSANQDAVAFGDKFFIRGSALVPITGSADVMGIGLWLQVTQLDFDDFNKHGRINHPRYYGRIANQTFLGAPTLGANAGVAFREGLLPSITFTDEHHPLSKTQHDGMSLDEVRTLMSATAHRGEPEPLTKPAPGDLKTLGWEIVEPKTVGAAALRLKAAPKAGDSVKVVANFTAAAETGAPATLNSGWWVLVDDTKQRDLWSGTLRDDPRVPSTLTRGSRIWFKPSQVIAVDSAQP